MSQVEGPIPPETYRGALLFYEQTVLHNMMYQYLPN